MKSTKVISIIVAAFFCANTSASVPMNAYQIPQNISIRADGTLEIIFPQVFNSGCTNGGGKRMFVKVGNSQGVTDQSLKQIQSFVLTAAIAKKPIKFWYDRINDTCEGGKIAMDVS